MAHPLLTSARQTRLLYLCPGNRADDLVCGIFPSDLDQGRVYDALSYAWDGEVKMDTPELPVKTRISCNGELLDITANLGRALQLLRDEKQGRWLWIDKICINQRDIGEREQQIRYMGEIFSMARSVIVWLGESDEDTNAVWTLIAQLRLCTRFASSQTTLLAPEWQTVDFDTMQPGTVPSSAGVVMSVPPELGRLPPITDRAWKCVDAFLNRAWFFRVWTLQEVVVSDQCHIMCGEHTMSWEDLCGGVMGLQTAGYAHITVPGLASILLRDSERQRRKAGQRASLRALLSCTRGMVARHVHDKVFGLLPLTADSLSSRLTVRYSRSLPSLFGDVVRACIEEDRSLAVLGEVGMHESNSPEIGSWIPDWRDHPSTPIVLNSWSAEQPLFRTAGNTEPLMLTSLSADTLVLRGFLVAPITRLLALQKPLDLRGVHRTPNKLKKRYKYNNWDALYTRVALALKLPPTVVKQPESEDDLSSSEVWQRPGRTLNAMEMIKTALRRTMTGDLYPRPNGRLAEAARRYHFPTHHAWKQSTYGERPGPPPRQVLWEHDCFVKSIMHNRQTFIAGQDHNAYLGIGLNTLREGDWICVLLGGDTPFILRPMHTSSDVHAADVEEWEFVSECYVHGLMDGEAMESLKPTGFRYKDFKMPPPEPSQIGTPKL